MLVTMANGVFVCYAEGVLVVGANLLLHLKQSATSLGFCLNAMADSSSSQVVFKHPPGLVVTMDGSQAVFLSGDHLLVALRGGDIFSLSLIPDGMRGLRNILFEKTASGVLPSCVSALATPTFNKCISEVL